MADVHVRPVDPAGEDPVAVAAIMEHYVRRTTATFREVPPTAEQWAARANDLSERGLPFLVAEDDGSVVGFAYVDRWRPQDAYRHTVEDTVYLAPGATGRGVGTALLSELLDRARTAGARQVVAVVAGGDPASVALHRRFGFTEAGRLREVGFKHDRWIDTVLFQCTLA